MGAGHGSGRAAGAVLQRAGRRRDRSVWVETDAQPEFVVRIGDCWYWGKTGVPTDKAENAAKYPTNGDAQKAIERLPKYADRSVARVEEFS